MRKHVDAECMQVWSLCAVATGRAERDPSADLKGALIPVKVKHHASVTDPKAIGALIRAINGYTGSFVTKCALIALPRLFSFALVNYAMRNGQRSTSTKKNGALLHRK